VATAKISTVGTRVFAVKILLLSTPPSNKTEYVPPYPCPSFPTRSFGFFLRESGIFPG
jgi:hypothetical protein